jgi:hypothetical protein
MKENFSGHKPAGYDYLILRFGLNVFPNWHSSFISEHGISRSYISNGKTTDIYPLSYWPGEGVGEQIEFALKYDGFNMGILSEAFKFVSESEIIDYIQSKPTGKYARRIWFIYEFITGKTLPLENIKTGNYIDVLESELYCSAKKGIKVKRQRILNNLLGGKDFCPVVRRTEKILEMENYDIREKCHNISKLYPQDIVIRASGYLYNKETKSSFDIEHQKPDASRVEKFIALLKYARQNDFCEKKLLIDLQNQIADPRFADNDYRKKQNYVGETVSPAKEIVHFIPPKPEDIEELMAGLILSHSIMKDSLVLPVLHAAVVSYGFVFLHPFEDGNGRIHRFLIHNILSLRNAVADELIFPISAVMLKNRKEYSDSLEAFSRPLMQFVEYKLDELGQMTVFNETVNYYKYMDMTSQVEALYDFIVRTIENEMVDEFNFLKNYDETKKMIVEIADIPDRLIDLFIKLCLQNKGNLSDRKRTDHFEKLSDTEISLMEQAVRNGFKLDEHKS